jgi:hypothetical protein
MSFYTNSSLIGVNLNAASATQDFALGSVCAGSDGTFWQYVNAATAVTAYQVVAISTSGTMGKCSIADAVLGLQIAVAQCAFSGSQYGWVPIHGTGGPGTTLKAQYSATTTQNVAIYIATSTGNLSTTASSATIQGIAIQTATVTAGITSYAAIITWPRCNYTGL